MMNTSQYHHNCSSSHSRAFLKIFSLLVTGFCLMFVTTLLALAEEPAQAPPKEEAKGGMLTEDDVKQANNPLANLSAMNIQNYYIPKLYDLPDKSANTAWIRGALSTWRILWRASLPLSTVPGVEESVSGLGDFNIFGAFLFTNQIGIGPLVWRPQRLMTPWEAGNGRVELQPSILTPIRRSFSLVACSPGRPPLPETRTGLTPICWHSNILPIGNWEMDSTCAVRRSRPSIWRRRATTFLWGLGSARCSKPGISCIICLLSRNILSCMMGSDSRNCKFLAA